MVQVGDRIRINGTEDRVIGRIASGRHVKWYLESGETIIDLEEKVAAGNIEVLREEQRLTRRERREIERMTLDDDDTSEA